MAFHPVRSAIVALFELTLQVFDEIHARALKSPSSGPRDSRKPGSFSTIKQN